MTTPARWALEVLNKSLKDVSQMTGVSEGMVELYTNENFINNNAHCEFIKGEGMPQWFARDLAMGLWVHRGVFGCDLDNRIKTPIFKNTEPAIDGNYGTCHVHMPGKTRDHVRTMFRIPQSSASDFILPNAGEPVSFLDDRLDVHVLQLDKMVRFRTEEGPEENPVAHVDRFTSGIGPSLNPEIIFGAFEILMFLGAEAFFDARTQREFPGVLSEAYISAIQKSLEGWNMEQLLERLLTVRVHLTSGEQVNYLLKSPYSPLLDEFYRFCRDGELPPFFILNEDHWVECIPTSEIAMISIPWVLIAKYGAHIDAECQEHAGEDELPGSLPEGRGDGTDDEDDRIVLTDDLVTRKRR